MQGCNKHCTTKHNTTNSSRFADQYFLSYAMYVVYLVVYLIVYVLLYHVIYLVVNIEVGWNSGVVAGIHCRRDDLRCDDLFVHSRRPTLRPSPDVRFRMSKRCSSVISKGRKVSSDHNYHRVMEYEFRKKRKLN